MDFNQIQELLRLVNRLKLSEFKLEDGEFKLVIKNRHDSDNAVAHVTTPTVVTTPTPTAPAPAPSAPVAVPVAPVVETKAPEKPAAGADESKYVPIKSPMVGTFYRASGPDKQPFAKVGDLVEKGATVCIIEAMKLFNEIESEVKGKIVKVLVEDKSPVEYDQPLFLVDPT